MVEMSQGSLESYFMENDQKLHLQVVKLLHHTKICTRELGLA